MESNATSEANEESATYIDKTVYTECVICMEPAKDNKYFILNKCGHGGYCKACVIKLFDTNGISCCPRCRIILKEIPSPSYPSGLIFNHTPAFYAWINTEKDES